VVAAFFLPVLMRAYLLEGILAGPALAALFQTNTFSIGQALRLVGLLLLGPPRLWTCSASLSVCACIWSQACLDGDHRRRPPLAGGNLHLESEPRRPCSVCLVWESAEGPLFWDAGTEILALKIGLIGQAISH